MINWIFVLIACLQIKIEHVQWNDVESIVAITFALFGFIITGIVLIVFVKHNNTPVVKASTRELCYLILVGMIISHSSIFTILAKPSQVKFNVLQNQKLCINYV